MSGSDAAPTGFVPKTDDWRADVGWAGVIVSDDIWVGSDIGTGGLARELREQGKAVSAGRRTPITSRRTAATRWRSSKPTASTHRAPHVCEEFDAGIEHVRENPAPYVITPLGEVQNVKRLLYVGNEDDGSGVVDVHASLRKGVEPPDEGVPAQAKVEGAGDRLQAWGYRGA